MKATCTIALCCLALSLSSLASGQEPRAMSWEVEVNAPIAKVWTAFTTEEGLKSWMAPVVSIDLRIGGQIRANYRPSASLDDPTTVVQEILSFEPGRMYSARIVQRPQGSPAFLEVLDDAWGVTRFEDLGEDRTRVIVTTVGWGEGPQWDQAKQFFDQGNRYSFRKLKSALEPKTAVGKAYTAPPPTDRKSADQAWQLISKMVGGKWILDGKAPDGSPFRAVSTIELSPTGKTLIGESWLGNDQKLSHHGHTLVWREPGTGAVRFHNINERGDVAQGPIVLTGKNALSWDWKANNANGTQTHFALDMEFHSDDSYQMTMYRVDTDGQRSQLLSIEYNRMELAPAWFQPKRDPAVDF